MRYLAAAIVLFIGISADVAVASAANSASAAAPLAAHSIVGANSTSHMNPFIVGH